MNSANLVLRCYAKKDGDSWVAVCIDLGLAAQGDSLQDVKLKLESMTMSYVRDAVTVDREYADQLLNRRAPLSQVISYHFIKYRNKIGKFKDSFKTFIEVLPLVPSPR